MSAPTYSSMMLTCHALRIALVRNQQATMKTARLSSRTLLEAEIANDPTNRTLVTELAKLNNDISQGDFEAAQDVPVELTNQERMDYSNEYRNQSRRVAMLETH